eukprot:261049_1
MTDTLRPLSESCDVVIVGAGLAGLSTARKLQALCITNNVNLPSITIIEADGRVGGRTNTIHHKGIPLDIGAHWVGATHSKMAQLLEELNLDKNVYDQYNTGNKILDINHIQSLFRTEIPTPVGILSLIDVQLLILDLERITKTLYSEASAKQFRSHKDYLDSITMESLMHTLNIWTESCKQLFILLIRMVVGCEPSQVSALQFITMIKQSGYSVESLTNIENGYQQSLVRGGMQQISQCIAKQLTEQNAKCKLILNHAVCRIEQNMNNECIVYYAERYNKEPSDHASLNPTIKIEDISMQSQLNMHDTRRLNAKYVVSAVPLYMNGKYIEFNPKLPLKLSNVFSKCYAGGYWKGIAFFDECFWKKYGFSGEVMSDTANGPIEFCIDENTEHVNNDTDVLKTHWNGRKVYCLVGLSGGSPIYKWSQKTPRQRENAFLDQLALYFNKLIPLKERNGEDLVRKHFIEYIDVLWMDCGPFDIYPPGSGSHHFDLSAKGQKDFVFRNIHFASTNLASECCGYMEGAVCSGYAHAQIVFDRLYNKTEIKQNINDDSVEKKEFRYTSLKRKVIIALVMCAVALFVAVTYTYLSKERNTNALAECELEDELDGNRVAWDGLNLN